MSWLWHIVWSAITLMLAGTLTGAVLVWWFLTHDYPDDEPPADLEPAERWQHLADQPDEITAALQQLDIVAWEQEYYDWMLDGKPVDGAA